MARNSGDRDLKARSPAFARGLGRTFLGRTERRVVAAILLTALIPLVFTVLIARTIIQRVSAAAFQPEFSAHLHRALGVYSELAVAIKHSMRLQTEVMAHTESLREKVRARDQDAAKAELLRLIESNPGVVSLSLETCEGRAWASGTRGFEVDPSKERTLSVRRALSGGEPNEPCEPPFEPSVLAATLTTPRERFDELESLQEFAKTYDEFARNRREHYLDETYRDVFAVLLGFTIVLAIIAGILVVRPVTERIARLAEATKPVADGDLSVRVSESGSDEVSELGRAFNHMLEELDRSRARIEFLQRMGEWQKMARRLAHEIKNPLTPIQLAVEECHLRYRGDDAEFKRILETTLEVVFEEVSSLRRLVSEFASFARLPQAELCGDDLGDFLREQRAHLYAYEMNASGESGRGDDALFRDISIQFDIPEGSMPVRLDREMMHRVLTNLMSNAAQAIRSPISDSKEIPAQKASGHKARKSKGLIQISSNLEGGDYVINIDDNGGGIPETLRDSLFEPYVTTKPEGTGLGLSIVKKIIVDHGGSIEAKDSPLGGARFHIRIPRWTPASPSLPHAHLPSREGNER